jgi:uncharacterized Fe-S cluster protein YjdI
MAKRFQTYAGEHITVTFDPNLCIHSARCLAGLPAVFDVGRRKWIDVDAAPADDIARVIERCPSRALRYIRPGAASSPAAEDRDAAVTVVTLGTDGPLMLEGKIRVQTPRGELVRETDRVALCRCGGTGNQPFCDGSHLTVGFKSTR